MQATIAQQKQEQISKLTTQQTYMADSGLVCNVRAALAQLSLADLQALNLLTDIRLMEYALQVQTAK